ncbi:MAG: glycine betaine ABC transporter substrate-binding protein [Ardenticatenaceae bacterium]
MFYVRFSILTMVFIIMLLSTSCGKRPSTSVSTASPTRTIGPTSTSVPMPITPQPPTSSGIPAPTAMLTPTEGLTSSLSLVSVEPSSKAIVVGSNTHSDHLLASQILLFALQEQDYEVLDKTGMGGRHAVRAALEKGEIDLSWELTSTALSQFHGLPLNGLPNDPMRAFTLIKTMDEPQGLEWLGPTGANAGFRLMVRKDTMQEQGIVSVQDLADFINNEEEPLTVCLDPNFHGQPHGLAGLQALYGFEFKSENILVKGFDQIYEGLREEMCDVAVGFGTDGRITAWDLQLLGDPLGFCGPDTLAIVANQSVFDEHGELKDLLDEISSKVNHETLSRLHALVELGADGKANSGDEEPLEDVARDFVYDEITRPSPIVVGSKASSEHVWLGKMLRLLLSDAGYQVLDEIAQGSTNALREGLLEGEIDLYWEEMSSALALFHELPPMGLPADPERAWLLAKQLDEPNGLAWLNRANFETTYTLMMQPSTIEETGGTTIEELADFMNTNDAPLKVCVDQDFATQPNGLPGLSKQYGFKFKKENIVVSSTTASYEGLKNGDCEVAQGYTTGHHEAYGFQVLQDNQRFWLSLTPAPVIRQERLDREPELAELLSRVGTYLDNDSVNTLNRRVKIGPDGKPNSGDEEAAQTVARLFLCEAGLITQNCPIDLVPPTPSTEPTEPAGPTGPTPSTKPTEPAVPTQPTPSTEPTEPAESTEPIEPTLVCEEIVLNGGFESDEDWTLPRTALSAMYNTDRVDSGNGALLLGDPSSDDLVSHSVAWQRVAIPSDAVSATLFYSYYPISKDLGDEDIQAGLIYNSDISVVRWVSLWEKSNNKQTWLSQEHDISALIGEDVVLYFYVDNDGDGQPSSMYLDDVSVQVCSDSQ